MGMRPKYGTCQVCAKPYRTRAGLIVHHGQTDNKRQPCIGAGFAPMEVSQARAAEVAALWEPMLSATEAHYQELVSGDRPAATIMNMEAVRWNAGTRTPELVAKQAAGAEQYLQEVLMPRRLKFAALRQNIDHPPVAPPTMRPQEKIPRARVGEQFVRSRDKDTYTIIDLAESRTATLLGSCPYTYLCRNERTSKLRRISSHEVHRALHKQRGELAGTSLHDFEVPLSVDEGQIEQAAEAPIEASETAQKPDFGKYYIQVPDF